MERETAWHWLYRTYVTPLALGAVQNDCHTWSSEVHLRGLETRCAGTGEPLPTVQVPHVHSDWWRRSYPCQYFVVSTQLDSVSPLNTSHGGPISKLCACSGFKNWKCSFCHTSLAESGLCWYRYKNSRTGYSDSTFSIEEWGGMLWPTKPHGVAAQKINIDISAAVRTLQFLAPKCTAMDGQVTAVHVTTTGQVTAVHVTTTALNVEFECFTSLHLCSESSGLGSRH
jgi:hypothetical protein